MSWLLTSDKGPLLWRMSYIQGLGIDGPKVSDLTSTTCPISPASIRSRAVTKPASKRRMKPICNLTPARSTAARIWSHSRPSIAIGFSQRMACLPGPPPRRLAVTFAGRGHHDGLDPWVGQRLAVVGVDTRAAVPGPPPAEPTRSARQSPPAHVRSRDQTRSSGRGSSPPARADRTDSLVAMSGA